MFFDEDSVRTGSHPEAETVQGVRDAHRDETHFLRMLFDQSGQSQVVTRHNRNQLLHCRVKDIRQSMAVLLLSQLGTGYRYL
ncbi:MAG: hypothetical protein WBQ78_08560 [Gammaproteobacteria bacterium]